MWKELFVIPLHKKGSKMKASNFFGFSKMSAILKLKILLLPICSTSVGQFYSCLRGFMKRGSTTTNLLELTSFVIKGPKKHLQRDVIYRDFSKAFDSVNHVLLVRKLDLLGFPVDLLGWILTYLNCRTQRVNLKILSFVYPRYLRCPTRVTQ